VRQRDSRREGGGGRVGGDGTAEAGDCAQRALDNDALDLLWEAEAAGMWRPRFPLNV
jgi:hypothetical protein